MTRVGNSALSTLLGDIPVRRLSITLSLQSDLRTHFYHGGMLRGLLSSALESHELPIGLVPLPVESGITRYARGDRYRFGLTLAGRAVGVATTLLHGLRTVGKAGRQRGDVRLAGNFSVDDVDAVSSGTLLDHVEADTLSEVTCTLRARTPLRIPRSSSDRSAGSGFLDRRGFPIAPLLSRALGRLHALVHGTFPTAIERSLYIAQSPDRATTAPAFLFWLDVPIGEKQRSDGTRPKGYTLGGVLGNVLVTGLSPEWWRCLQAASMVHVGEQVSFGLGALDCWRLGSEAPPAWCTPARDLLDRALTDESVADARAHLGTLVDDASGNEAARIERVVHAVRSGAYVPSPLYGQLIEKDNGTWRALAVSPVPERVVQRAVSQQLAPAVDTLFEDCSFAYRRGWSVKGAVRAIERAYREGYRWVLDADISAFFDSVDLDRLEALLAALWPGDRVRRLVMQWLRAPVHFNGRIIERTRGLPQGLPISPILANLYLDELDEALLGEEFRLVRYADDFVVLCRRPDDVRRAREQVQAVLDRLGLTLHATKTRETTFDDGFTFLGHLFCKSLVLQSQGGETGREMNARTLDVTDVPSHSWLAQVPLRELRELRAVPGGRVVVPSAPSPDGATVPSAVTAPRPSGVADRPGDALRAAPRRTASAVVSLSDVDAHERRFGIPLCVWSSGTTVRLRTDTIECERPDGTVASVPVRAVASVLLGPGVRVSSQALVRLADARVVTLFVRSSGRMRAWMSPPADWPTWSAQERLAADPHARRTFTRAIVRSRLTRIGELLRGSGDLAAVQQVEGLLASAVEGADVDQLRGLEGRAARVWFEGLRSAIPEAWGFLGRERQPPPDPVNGMLSFGYMLLHHLMVSLLVSIGCNPRLGLYHVRRAGHDALASDLVEEWRHVIEAVVRREALAREPWKDFVRVGRGCYLAGEARRQFTAQLMASLCDERAAAVAGQSILERMGAQAIRYREWATGHAPAFVPAAS